MDITQLLIGGAAAGGAVGILTGCWQYVKDISWKVCNLFIDRAEIKNYYSITENIAGYLIENYKFSKVYDKVYNCYEDNYKNGRYGKITYEKIGDSTLLFWKGWIPFIYRVVTETSKDGSAKNITVYLLAIRGTLNLERIIKEATNIANERNWNILEKNKENNTRYTITYIPSYEKDKTGETTKGIVNDPCWWTFPYYKIINTTIDKLGKPRSKNHPLEQLIFPKYIKNLIEEIKVWYKSKQWYNERNIPWKRGWLLYGIPGTGKTSCARAFAEELDMPIFIFNLSELGNYEFVKEWKAMQKHTPCIALFEDIDNVFHGRENICTINPFSMLHKRRKKNKPEKDDHDWDEDINQGGFGVKFDTFINCLDGVDRIEGVFTILTTNDITKIDPTLGGGPKARLGESISSRPGRIDNAIELTYMEKDDKIEFAKRILKEFPEILEQELEFIEENPELQETPAQCQEKYAQLALKEFWKTASPSNTGRVEDTVKLNGKVSKDIRERLHV